MSHHHPNKPEYVDRVPLPSQVRSDLLIGFNDTERRFAFIHDDCAGVIAELPYPSNELEGGITVCVRPSLSFAVALWDDLYMVGLHDGINLIQGDMRHLLGLDREDNDDDEDEDEESAAF